MSDIVGDRARVSTAFDQPTLRLLNQRDAIVIIAMFRTAFSTERPRIPTVNLHQHVETCLDELRAAGISPLPQGAGRTLCQRWMGLQWLVRSTEDDGSEVYSLTSHAIEGIDTVQRMMRDRASLSEHKIATIVDAARRFNAEANPDRAARIAILDAEIATRQGERDRLAAGGEMATVTEESMLRRYIELQDLVSGLPTDFLRVEESFNTLRGNLLDSFRTEGRPAGQVVDEYLNRADRLMSATAEGRAFEGAFDLLRDEQLLLQLREDLRELLEHPLGADILTDTDRSELAGTVRVIRSGIESVLARRARVTATLREYIATHDATHDRELEHVLRHLDDQLTTWLTHAGARATVPLTMLPERVDVAHLRERFSDTAVEPEPAPLATPEGERPDTLNLEDLRAVGGPTMNVLRERLHELITNGDFTTLGAMFTGLDPTMRRPVEILGALHVATNRDDIDRHSDLETYPAVRPDGQARTFLVPRVATTEDPTDEH